MGSVLQFPEVPREGGRGEGEAGAGADLAGARAADSSRRKGRELGHEGALYPYINRYTKERTASIKQQTAYGQRRILGLFADNFGDRDVTKMGEADVLRFLLSVRHRKPSTRRTYLGIVKGFTGWLVDKNTLKRDPCRRLKPPRQPRSVPKVFLAWELEALLAVCPDARARLVVLLGVQMALRIGEIAGLELGDIGPGMAHIVGKGGHEREVPIPQEVRWALREYLADRGEWSGPLIENKVRPGTGVMPHTIGQMIRELCITAGVKKAAFDGKSAHGLRRTGATHMADRGNPVEKVAKVLGHKNTKTTEDYYIRSNSRKLADVVEGRWYGRRAIEEVS